MTSLIVTLIIFLDCNGEGTVSVIGNICSCKTNIVGTKCDLCDYGYFNFPTCDGKCK